jgi:hypothetical protein
VLTRVLLVPALALPLVLAGAANARAGQCDPASGGGSADGYWVCTGSGSGTISVGDPTGVDAGTGPSDPGTGSVGSGSSGSGQVTPPCTYLDFDPNRGTEHPAGHEGEPGQWAFSYCGDDGTALGWTWLPTGGAAPPTVQWPSPAELASEAYRSLALANPVPDYNPRHRQDRPDGTVVGVDSWLWVDQLSTGSKSATATAAPNSATVTASAVSVSFDPGDGTPLVSCPGGGTRYVPGGAGETSSCVHRYVNSSAAAPGGVFRLTATVTWSASWQGSGGTGGALPDRTVSGAVDVQVDELQAVNN